MESLNLNNLVTSLPASNLANAEKDLVNHFRAAALSITTMYKSSRRTSKRAYNTGYAAACQDLLLMIQQGVSAGESSDRNGEGMTIGRIMDYIEARLEAIKSREEEEDEDEEKEKERERERERGTTSSGLAKGVVSVSKQHSTPPPAATKHKDVQPVAPMTPLSPPSSTSSGHAPIAPSSPSPSPSTNARPFGLARMPKSRLHATSNANSKEAVMAHNTAPFPSTLLSSSADAPVTIIPPLGSPPLSLAPLPAIPDLAGTKRRHAVMVADSTNVPLQLPAGTSRRRTRSARTGTLNNDQNHVHNPDEMDVEEEGRERKRVARR